jgi:hypothetical protein
VTLSLIFINLLRVTWLLWWFHGGGGGVVVGTKVVLMGLGCGFSCWLGEAFELVAKSL